MLKQYTVAAIAIAFIGSATFVTPPAAGAAMPGGEHSGVRVNEVESSGGEPGDWVEFFNDGDAAVDLSGFTFKDSDDAHRYVLPVGSVIAPGGFLVLGELQGTTGQGHFDFGLGKADSARLFDTAGTLVDSRDWPAHAATTFGVTEAGGWNETTVPTRGEPNLFADPVAAMLRLNEVDSQPADWVELVNTGSTPLELGGYELRDNSDDHRWRFPAGAEIAAGAFLVVDAASVGLIGEAPGAFGDAIGIGSADRIRLFSPEGELLDDTGTWEGHAAVGGDFALATLARCPDGTGDFTLATPTPGAGNVCVTAPGPETTPGPEALADALPWPGNQASRTIDTRAMFLEDSSGLDTQQTEQGVVLWAVDNGEGRFWKLDAGADGSASFAEGWESGKRARFQRDAAEPQAKGPDTEGITAAGDGFIYLASERDNGAKGVNQNTILKVDPNAPGPDVIASQEWDITAILPPVGANLGIEAIEWVADADLAGKLHDTNTGAPYLPESYPGTGGGIFFVAVEDGGRVIAIALSSDGSAQLISELEPGLAGVMALDWDTVRGGLWAVCDDGCNGASAFLTLNGTANPERVHYARPGALPNTNNEGFATAPASLITSSTTATSVTTNTRPAWWFTDGAKPGALHTGTVVAAVESDGETPGRVTPGRETPAEQPGKTLPGATAPAGRQHLATTGGNAPALLGMSLAALAALAGAGALALGLRSRSHR